MKFRVLENDVKEVGPVVAKRIVATRMIHLHDGTVIKPGTFGGYVQSEANLSQDGACWIMDNAVVLGKARVVGNAIVRDTAMLCQRAQAMGDVVVSGDTHMGDCSKASGCVVVHSQMLTGIDHLHKDKEAA
jgi:hypothetical protein